MTKNDKKRKPFPNWAILVIILFIIGTGGLSVVYMMTGFEFFLVQSSETGPIEEEEIIPDTWNDPLSNETLGDAICGNEKITIFIPEERSTRMFLGFGGRRQNITIRVKN